MASSITPSTSTESGAGGASAYSTEIKLINEKDFEDIQKQMVEEDERREQLIKRSREVLKLSKNSIYALHRGEMSKASEQVASALEIAKRDLMPIVEQFPTLRFGAFSGALEEYAEACCFLGFLKNARVPTMAELEIVTKEEYLGGVMDFTGELTRYAVLRATARDIEAVKRCRDCLDQLFSQLMLFEWRNGNLRRKFDAVKYTLKKLEQIIYELTLASSGFVPKGGVDEGPAPVASGGDDGGYGEGNEESMGGAGDGEGGDMPEGGGGGGRGGSRGGRGGGGGRGGKRQRGPE